jgi:transcriptional regulator with PAS, ATPase and Fis domain
MRHAVESKVTVLITGESGTGKELIARAMHYNSRRSSAAFVAVNCAGIPDQLLESELFGFEKGAFTGASMRKAGKFEIADGGTIFLDEIGEMPTLLQSKLLRVLQEKEVERLGSNRPMKLDLRVVCATNRDLMEEVKAGRFREDLYYRLAVFPVALPSLRERKGDVAVLAQHFLKKAAQEEEKQIERFDSAAWATILDYDYPGNVRELQNIISHAVVICDGPTIQHRHLPRSIRPVVDDEPTAGGETRRVEDVLMSCMREPDDIPKMANLETLMIQRAVELSGGNLTKAAKRLGISRATIYRRIGKLETVR